MHVEIKATPPGPLRLVPTLPASRVVMLEGLNGIGKTLAVRLLQICAGDMPYRTDSAAWRSLCVGLGAFSVTATEVFGATSIYWEADSHDWIDNTPAEGPVSFRRIDIDGRSSSLDEVRSIVGVHRLACDEDLVETLAQRADNIADSVRSWSRRFTSVDAGPLATLEERLNHISEVVGEWSSGRYNQLLVAAKKGEEMRTKRVLDLERSRQYRDQVVDARRVRHQLGQLASQLPTITAEIANVDSAIDTLRADRDQTYDAITALAGQVASAAPIAHELQKARRTLDRNRDNLSVALDALAVAAAEAEVEPSTEAIAAKTRAIEEKLKGLTQAQASLDKAPAMRDLLDVSAARLSQAEHEGLGDQVMIDDPETDIQLSVSQARAGMASRRAQIDDQIPAPEAADIARQLKWATRQLDLLRIARLRAFEASRFRRLVDQNQQRVDTALKAFDPSAVERLQQLEARRRVSDEQMLQLAAHRAALRQQLGDISSSETPEQAADHLARALQGLGLSETDLDDALSRAEEHLGTAVAFQRDAEESLRLARRELARAEAEVKRVSVAMTSPDLRWLREALPAHAVPSSRDTVAQQAAAIGSARVLLDKVTDRLAEHRGQLGAIENGLRGLARRLRGQTLETRRYVEDLETWLGQHFSEWFNIQRVRQELLPEADGPIVVDLHNAEVRWNEGSNERARPLEAFSSGEQAFAYTRARLAILDEEEQRPSNRLIVLDEFGAFIAHDRLTGLLAYLQDRAVEHPADQVVIILPLSRDYSSMAADTMGAEATRYGSLADQIVKRGYAVQVLVP